MVSDAEDKGQPCFLNVFFFFSSTCFEEPPGVRPEANEVASGCPVYTPSQICGASGVGPGQGAEDGSKALTHWQRP